MPAVKGLHQESESNSKPAFIMGHSFQAVGILVGALKSVFAVPLISRIHEGVVVSNRDKKTLLDKMIAIIESLGIDQPFYFIADAYYASGKIVRKLLKNGNHLITRVKNNAVAYYPATEKNAGRGRKKGVWEKKSTSANLFGDPESMLTAPSPIYGETNRPTPVSLGRSDLAPGGDYGSFRGGSSSRPGKMHLDVNGPDSATRLKSFGSMGSGSRSKCPSNRPSEPWGLMPIISG